jgi:intein-encoded DNA endonuclease-like protein
MKYSTKGCQQRAILLKDKVIKLFDEGNNVEKIFKLLRISRKTLRKYLKQANRIYSSCGKLNIDSNVFNQINTEEKAYWLGFLYADGCVHIRKKDKKLYYYVELTLKESDKEHLEKFKKFLKSDHPIKFKEKVKAFRIMFSDVEIGKDLIKLGCVPKKSLILKFPNEDQVPKHLLNHFIRGYFDGDGSLSLYKTSKGFSGTGSLLGTKEFLTSLLSYLESINIKEVNAILKKDKRNESNTYNILVGFTGKRKEFFNLLYENCTVYLQRKYNSYLIIKKTNE